MTEHAANRGSVWVRLLRLTSWFFVLAGIGALGYAAYVVVGARHFQATEAANFTNSTSTAPGVGLRGSQRPHRASMVPANGSVIGTIEIPRVGINAVVVQGDSTDILRRAVGHIPGTALPGEAGNVALAGHRDTIFRPLRKISVGDLVEFRTKTEVARYRVSSTEIVRPTDVAVLRSRGKNELTLITCFPFYYVGHAPERFVVRAGEIGTPPN